MKKNIYFISNNSASSRFSLLQKIKNYGFPSIELDQIFTSGYLASKYISGLPEIKKVYTIGMQGLYDELEALGLNIIKSNVHNGASTTLMNQKVFQELDVDKDVNCVCVGIDLNYNYYKLCYGSICIDQNKAAFVCCDDDGYIMVGERKMPICGSVVRSIAKVCDKEPVICGKPNPFVINLITQEKGLKKEECLMIGDSIESDVNLAKNAGIDSLVLLSGVTSEETLLSLYNKGEIKSIPNYYAEHL